jgi:hypothetical protein
MAQATKNAGATLKKGESTVIIKSITKPPRP